MIFLQAFLLTAALSADCLAAGFVYGTNKIKIPFLSGVVISLVSAFTLAVALFSGDILSNYISETITAYICAGILIFMGLVKVLGCFFEKKARNSKNKIIKFFASPEEADKNKDKILSKKEALIVAAALSIDGLAAGLGEGLVNKCWLNYLIIVSFSLFFSFIFLLSGSFIGKKIADKIKINLSWIPGIVLIGIAVMKIFV